MNGLPDLGGRRVVIDVGCGDGRFPYEMARADPDSFYLGLDPDASALARYAYRASRKPSRGGVGNVAFVVTSLEAAPPELAGIGDRVCVNFPWAGLLRGLLTADTSVLTSLLGLVKPGGDVDLVLTFDAGHDAGIFGDAAAPDLDREFVSELLAPAYARCGLEVRHARELSREEALAMPSSWGRRLLHGRKRRVFRIEGTNVGRAGA